jgi:hypothetical protein
MKCAPPFQGGLSSAPPENARRDKTPAAGAVQFQH